jgi:hypothetical protein
MNMIESKKNMFIEIKILKNENLWKYDIVQNGLKISVCMKLIYDLTRVCCNMWQSISYAHSAGNECNE